MLKKRIVIPVIGDKCQTVRKVSNRFTTAFVDVFRSGKILKNLSKMIPFISLPVIFNGLYSARK